MPSAQQLPAGVTQVTSLSDKILAIFGLQRVPGLPAGAANDTRAFGAGEPMKPQLEHETPPRSMIAPMLHNTTAKPRRWKGGQLTAFEQLRSLAEFDLVQIAMRDVIGQIQGMEWDIRLRKKFEGTAGHEKKIEQARAFVEMPDPLAGLDFRAWSTKVLEEILVTDALTILPRRTIGGEFLGLEQIDGATIIVLVDDRGRPPISTTGAFVPAYQQLVNGAVETEFAFNEIWYLPRNRRPDSPYGRSNVEQVLMTLNLAVRTYLHDMAYYSDGNLPEGFLFLKDAQGWDSKRYQQILEFLNDRFKGRSDNRSGSAMPFPEGTFVGTKTREWSPEFYEWMARVVCHSFQVSPLPLVRLMNRGTSETSETAGMEGGVRPLADFFASVLNRCIDHVLGLKEVEFAWGDDEVEDPDVVARRNVAYFGAGMLTLNAVRSTIGEKAYEPELGDEPMLVTPTGPIFLRDVVRERLQAEQQDAARIDSKLIQRAFLEVPILRRDELRASLGLPPVGGAEGEEFITIELPTFGAPADGAPVNPSPGGADNGTTDKPSDKGDGAGDEPGKVPPTDKSFPSALLNYSAAVREELATWRKVALRRAKAGKAQRRFLSHVLSPQMRAKIHLEKTATPEQVEAVFNGLWPDLMKGEATPSAAQLKAEAKLTGIIQAWLKGILPAVTKWALNELPEPTDKLRKADMPPIDPTEFLKQIEDALALGHQAGSGAAKDALGVDFETPPAAAVDYASKRAAELVGKKLVDGVLIDNPDRTWVISDTLRADIRAKVETAITEGWSPQELTKALRESFGSWRSETIARTETGYAYGDGAVVVYREAGVGMVEIVDGAGCLPEGHDDSAPEASALVGVMDPSSQANGQIWGLDQYSALKLAHPNCVRAALPYFVDEADAQEAA